MHNKFNLVINLVFRSELTNKSIAENPNINLSFTLDKNKKIENHIKLNIH